MAGASATHYPSSCLHRERALPERRASPVRGSGWFLCPPIAPDNVILSATDVPRSDSRTLPAFPPPVPPTPVPPTDDSGNPTGASQPVARRLSCISTAHHVGDRVSLMLDPAVPRQTVSADGLAATRVR